MVVGMSVMPASVIIRVLYKMSEVSVWCGTP